MPVFSLMVSIGICQSKDMKIVFILEILGTVAFAVSGAIVGIQKKMDMFGVVILGLTTAVGGGVMRDLMLNITPPAAFQRPVFSVVAIAVSLLIFMRSVRIALEHKSRAYENMLLIMDTIGLALFTVIGVEAAQDAIAERNLFLVTFVGVLTGVGGGVIRDVFAGITPSIFTKHFYACASIAGAWTCALLWTDELKIQAMFTGAVVTVMLRVLAAHYRWSLPKAK